MNIVKRIDQYDEDNIYFCEPIKNNVMNDGYFIRIIYSNSLFILNGINLLIQLNDVVFEKYYNKYKCSFNLFIHKDIMECIRQIEEKILIRSHIRNKIPQNKIHDQMRNGNIKLFLENVNETPPTNNNFILKISGIWETDTHYGLTYKFLKAND